ncbi:MAG: pyridoxal phosphate-dependent aminotransferase [Patescibacteria group bacterium]|jgi:aminotransferase
MKFSNDVNKLYAEGAFVWGDYAINQEKTSGKPVLKLQIGQPDFLPHPLIRQAIADAFIEGKTGYGPPLGMDAMRVAVAQEVQHYYKKAKITKDNVAITSGGGKSAIGVICRALINKDEKVLVPCYDYPGHLGGISDVGAVWKPYRLLPEKNYDIDVVDLEKQVKKIKPKTIIILSPGNPTGGAASYEALKRVAFLAKKYDLNIIADEIYRGHVFDNDFVSIMDFPGMDKRTVVIDGPGKRNCLPGVRMGYIIGPAKFIDGPVRTINNVRFSCPETPVQIGLTKTINNPKVIKYIEEMRIEFKKRRDYVVDTLNSMPGVTCPKPGGAFYVFPDISKTGLTGDQFAKKLLKEKNVCVLPGESFGGGMIDPTIKKPYGTYCVRISIASSIETLKEALSRMKDFIVSNHLA